MTERVRMSFQVKAFPDGQPWICLQPVQEDLIRACRRLNLEILLRKAPHVGIICVTNRRGYANLTFTAS